MTTNCDPGIVDARMKVRPGASANIDHLYSLAGTWRGEWLARTGRPGPAMLVTRLAMR